MHAGVANVEIVTVEDPKQNIELFYTLKTHKA